MKTLRGLLVVVLMAGVVLTGLRAVSTAQAAEMPAVGATAPDFTLKSQEGTPVRLSDLRGKWVVLYFYPKDFTRGCTIEARNFQLDQPKYHAKNAMVVGVSVDSVESHKEFCAQEGLEFKLLADEKKEVVKLYGSARENNGVVVAQRNTFIIDPKGVVAKVFVGVDPNKHSEEVLMALAEIQK